ncbi:family 78 glycoside hydrolase catalytic domain [Granulicella pectinivorans]|nr:family 78 glycoside hydrolase catalytic domain [Granulicella pectinivorans]
MRKIATLLFSCVVATASAAPIALRTNGLNSPIGLDTPHPVFSWRSDATRANWTQSAYEVLVATDAAHLSPGKTDTWDSGKIPSSESVNITYAGPTLKPQQRYLWTVLTWDDKGKETTSKPATFETGLSTWQAQWITRKDPANEAELAAIRWVWLPGTDAMHVGKGVTAHFRYILHLSAAPTAASLHVDARGKFVAHVNGYETGHHDEWSAFDREEIASLLHAGDNEILIDEESRPRAKEGTPAALAASIHVTDASGTEQRIVTDKTWQSRANDNASWQPANEIGPLSLPFGIATDRNSSVPGPDRIADDVSLLRKEFPLAENIRSARLSVTALGAYEAFVNGKSVSPDGLLAPGWTDFHKRVLYQTYDVTSLLNKGPNAIGVTLGGGWYSSPMTWAGFRYTPGPNLLRAQLDVTLADGTHQIIATDPSWVTAPAPITFSEIYGGESYDARLVQPGWNAPNFPATHWTPAEAGTPPQADIALTAQPDLPIHTTITLTPKTITPVGSTFIYDMGQNMVGNVRLHIQGPRGEVVKLRYAERLNPDGSIYTQNLRNADATDTYALSGVHHDEVWIPAFTFHGFRYVELSFLGPDPMPSPTLATIEGVVYNSLPATPSVRLSSSSETLNKMNGLGAWGQRGNFVSIPTDCPQRDERLGWMGDAGVFWRTGTYNFDIDAFTHKFMLDVEDAQTPAGAFTDVSPNILGRLEGAPGWGDAGVFIPYAAWLQYGDLNTVKQAWPAMERWMTFILETNPNYLRQKSLGNNYADWLAPDQNTPKDLIATAYWALIAREMVEMAKALGRPEDAAKYQSQYDHIAAAYRAAYVKEDGTVAGNTQASYLATIATGIAPESQRAAMVDKAVKDIEAHGNHLTTGFLGTPFLLNVLDENDRSDIAFRLLLSDTYPSWGYMVKKGATTWWERWNGDTGDPGMNSYNHYAFGSVMAWVYRRAAGIDTDATGPGYHHLTVHPHFNAALPQLHTEYDSVYGTIVSDWKQSSKKFTITIPPNTTATVILPSGKTDNIGSGTHTYTVSE